MEKDKLVPPTKDFANQLHEYFKDGAKSLTGGFLNPLIDILLPSQHQKLFEKWCYEVYSAILELGNKKITIEELRNNLEFISILKESMIIASKNHQQEKLKMLKVGLINSLTTSIPFDRKLIFTRFIDSLGLTQNIILDILSKELDKFKSLNTFDEIYKVFLHHHENLLISKNELIFILNDLDRNRLIKLSKDIEDEEIVKEASRFITGYGNSNLPFLTMTDFGSQYLKYILEENE